MKTILSLIITLLVSNLSFSQFENRRVQSNPKSKLVELEKESFLFNLNYKDVKIRLDKYDQKPTVKEVIQKLDLLSEERTKIHELEEVVMDLYSLTNAQLADIYSYYRRNSFQKVNGDLESMSDLYFVEVQKEFGENALLVQLKDQNEKHNSVLKKSFSSVFGGIIDYTECLVCCPKNDFPDEKWFWFKPALGTSIVTRKAEYDKWYSNKLCGFMIYGFPCNFSKSRFKVNVKGTLLWLLNGTPRFKQLAPNGEAVHISMLPVIITLGIKDLKTPPCENEYLQNQLRNLVQVRCN
ncbi:hypothetical protein [Jiulongibacter sp. NS-SX5]|uniref:hypothetical protein n=1 Tax=Jiulongibacter sp. NS-SX5 TaxID=3463854 RepID=UPI00405848A3